MRVQSCPSCGARYNVERVPPNSTFECKRCGQGLTVEAAEAPPKRFALGLLVAGTLALLGLLLWANPKYGVGVEKWPWDVLREEGVLSVKVAIGLWALAGVWAVLSSLGLAVRSRGVVLVPLAGVLLMVSAADTHFAVGDLQATYGLAAGLAMIALTAGLLTHDRPGRERVGRALAFGGGLLLVAYFAIGFRGDVTRLHQMVTTIGEWFDGNAPDDPWRTVFPAWALLVAGALGVLVGFGTRGGWLRWTGAVLLLVYLLMGTGTDLVEGGLGKHTVKGIATYGYDALVVKGLALWWLGSAAVADVVRAGRRQG